MTKTKYQENFNMYRIKRGRLFCDEKEFFALGQSYYPSFHTAKYPVPPEGDRIHAKALAKHYAAFPNVVGFQIE